jgi:sugar phosphate isomerase/epimerase
MNNNRREFLKLGGNLAAAIALAPLAGKLLPTGIEEENAKAIKTFGIQLWTIREALAKDPKGVLKQLADDGYKQIESFEGAKGMFWGMSNTDFKKYMDELGVTVISSHCDINKDFEKKAADASAIGMKYLICPWKGPQKSLDNFKKFAAEFNEKGEICRKNGIRFAYHNHDYSFTAMDGQFPQDVMITNTDPSLVDFEMDMYWVVTAGQDPITWLKKYRNRFRLCHLKDRKKNTTDKDASCILGQGGIDYPAIAKVAKKQGMQYYIVEQERYDNSTPMDSAKADAEYMKKMKV